MGCRHFLSLNDLTTIELQNIIDRAIELKTQWPSDKQRTLLKNRVMAMIFEKSSTRTRVSFEVAMIHFGGSAIFLSPSDTQLGRGEPIEDSARVLSRMTDLIMMRTFEQQKIERFAKYSSVPVINALTDMFHPCQLLADMQTFQEHRGSIKNKTVTWIGDGNNMCHSYMNAARQFGFKLKIACPEGYDPDASIMQLNQNCCEIVRDPMLASEDSDLITTDVWTSMGQEQEQAKRLQAFAPYKVSNQHMQRAKPDAVFMHCLPAHRGEEVDADVIDGTQSIVWDQAENRLHAQKALIEFLAAQAGII